MVMVCVFAGLIYVFTFQCSLLSSILLFKVTFDKLECFMSSITCMSILPPCMYMHHCISSAHGSQKALAFLGLELQMVMNQYVGARN